MAPVHPPPAGGAPDKIGAPQIWPNTFVTPYRDTRTELTKNWFHTFPLSIFIFIQYVKELYFTFTRPITSQRSSYATGLQLNFPEYFSLGYAKMLTINVDSANVTYTTAILQRQMLTTKLFTMKLAMFDFKPGWET